MTIVSEIHRYIMTVNTSINHTPWYTHAEKYLNQIVLSAPIFLIEELVAPTIYNPPMLNSGQTKRLAQNHSYSTLTSNQAKGGLEAYTEAHLRKNRGLNGKKVLIRMNRCVQ